MKKKLSLEKEAKKRGEANDPPTEVENYDDIEQRIITAIESEKNNAFETFMNNLKAYGERIRSLDFQTKFTNLIAAADTASSDFIARVHEGKDILFQLRRDVVRIENELKSFRKEHKLERMPHYPTSYALRISLPFALIAVESALNGLLISKGHELGLVGGIGTALLISFLNVIIGLSVGFFFRQKNHKNILKKA